MYRNSMSVMLSHSLVVSYTAVGGEFRSYFIFYFFYKLPMSLEKNTIDHTVSNIGKKTRTYSGSTDTIIKIRDSLDGSSK